MTGALHQHPRGQGFKSRISLNSLQALHLRLQKLRLQDLQLLDTTTVLIYDFHIFIIYFPSIVLQATKGNSTAITGKIIQEASQ